MACADYPIEEELHVELLTFLSMLFPNECWIDCDLAPLFATEHAIERCRVRLSCELLRVCFAVGQEHAADPMNNRKVKHDEEVCLACPFEKRRPAVGPNGLEPNRV